jgi:hypothetical protein
MVYNVYIRLNERVNRTPRKGKTMSSNNNTQVNMMALQAEIAQMTDAELFNRANELNAHFDRMDTDALLAIEFDMVMEEKMARRIRK